MAVIGNAPFQGLVSGGEILDASIEGVDLSTSAIAARLGYTPVDPGAAVFSANPTISSGSTYGVPYLSGSKVVTTGSVFTFNGTNVGIGLGGVASNAKLEVAATTGEIFRADGTGGGFRIIANQTDILLQGVTSIQNWINGTEQMRLTSTSLYTASGINVGIGTSSPDKRLHLYAANDAASVRFTNTAAGKVWDLTPALPNVSNSGFSLYNVTDNTVPLHITDSGNLGLQTTPEAWGVYFKPIQYGNRGGYVAGSTNSYSGNSHLAVGNNGYFNSAGSWIATVSDAGGATQYYQVAGTHRWNVAGPVTAGSGISFTEMMNLSSSGLNFPTSASGNANISFDGSTFTLVSNSSSAPIVFATNSIERMRLDYSGKLGIGRTSPNYSLDVFSGSTATAGGFGSTATTGYNPVGYNGTAARLFLSGGNANNSFTGIQFTHGASFEAFFGAVQDSSGLASFVFQGYNGNAYTEYARITPAGSFGIGTGSPADKFHVLGRVRFGENTSYYGTITHDAAVTGANIYDSVDTGGHVFRRSGTESARINGSGRLCIGYSGTWNDSAPYLHVRDGIVIGNTGSAALFTSIKSSNGYDLTLTANANPANLGVNANIIFSSGNSGGGGPSELMRIISDGRVGIGTSIPGYDMPWASPTLDISGSRGALVLRTTGTSGIATLRMVGPAANANDDWHINMGAGTNSTISFNPKAGGGNTGLVLRNDGTVGVGVTSSLATAKLDVAGAIKSGRTVYNWFQWGGNPSGQYLHIKTSLWSGGGGSNSQPTMSLFHIKGYNYDAHTIDAMIGFHNWSGAQYSLRVTNSGSWTGSHSTYTSTDGYVVLVIHTGTSYPGISIDYHQSFPYGYQDVTVTAYSSSTSGSGGVY